MKKLIITLVLLFGSMNIQANERFELCSAMSFMAESIMTARQENVDASVLVKLAYDDPDITELVLALIQDAYDTPRFATESVKQSTIRDFKNEIFMICLNQRK